MKTNIHFWSYLAHFFLEWEMFQKKFYRENRNTHFVVNYDFSKIVPFVRKMWKNIAELDRPQMRTWRMHIAYWIHNTTNTHSEYVILIVFHCNSGCTSQCYVTHTVSVLVTLQLHISDMIFFFISYLS
jgi:hypothetical protein